MIKLTIPGEPVGKARARVTRWGTYNPEKTVNYETQIKERFAACYPQHKPIEGPVEINIKTYFSIPKSVSKKKRTLMDDDVLRPMKKPDLSNILKIIEDALNKIAYEDDKQIVKAIITKHYCAMPRAEINIKELENEN